jgi:hypothetical protein
MSFETRMSFFSQIIDGFSGFAGGGLQNAAEQAAVGVWEHCC